MMQSAASAFPIGQYDAIATSVLLSLFLLIPVHRVFFFGVLFRTLRDSSFPIGKQRDPPRTFFCIYICFGAGISLTLSLLMPKESSLSVTNYRDSAKNHRRLCHQISREPALKPGGFQSNARPLNSATATHGSFGSHPNSIHLT